MASVSSKVIYSETGAPVAGFTTDKVTLENLNRELILTLVVKNNTGTVDVAVDHSPNGIDWFELHTFTQVAAASGSELLNIDKCLGHVRASITNAGGAADIDLRMNHSNQK